MCLGLELIDYDLKTEGKIVYFFVRWTNMCLFTEITYHFDVEKFRNDGRFKILI